MIKYIGKKQKSGSSNIYLFLINGLEKEVGEFAFRKYPECYRLLPQKIKEEIEANKKWLSRA